MNQTPILPPAGSHFISLSRGIEMTALYRAERDNILAEAFQHQNILPLCETFNRADVDTVLDKDGCEALRVYFGMDETLKVRVLIVGVRANGEDILPLPSTIGPNANEDEDDIIEEGHRCPPACPPPSPLNP